jgi:glutamate racemase
MNRPIGVFDSGIGGLTVLKELSERLPNEDFIYYADSINAPYGPKSAETIIEFSDKIIRFLLEKNCKLIVIACNTATAAAVYEMRQRFSIPVVGLEPAVKPACLNTKTGHVGVLATEGTFRGNHFKTTSDKYKEYVTLHLQVAKGLVEFAENGIYDGLEVENLVKQYVNPLINQNVDQLVLGCTHYPLFLDIIQAVVGQGVAVIDSAEAVARRTKDILMTQKIFRTETDSPNIIIYSTGDRKILKNVVSKLFFVEINNRQVELNFI